MRPADIADEIRRRGGVVRTRVLAVKGVSKRQLVRAVAAGAITRVRTGVYAIPELDPWVGEAAAHGGELACAAALRRRGVWILEADPRVHVWLGERGRRMAHEGCRCRDHHDRGASAFGTVSLPLALVQVCRCLGDEAFFAAFESAWRRGLLDAAGRAEVRGGLPAGKRWLVDIARGDADSGPESLLRLRLHRLGVTMASQVDIDGVGRVDFVIDGVLILEADGRKGHARESERHKDLVRDARAAAAGYQTLRFDYAMIVHDWPTVEAAVLHRLAAIRRDLRSGAWAR